jgi:glycosyltransferase involved in cell wall biosynthesis
VAKTSIAARSAKEMPRTTIIGVATPALTPAKLRRPTLSVLIAVPSLESGAADEDAVALARVLADAGHRAVVVSGGGRMERDVAAYGAETVRLNMASRSPLTIARNAFTLRRLIERHRCAVVHALARGPAWSALAATRMAGIPLVTTWYNAFREQNAFKHLYNSGMARGERAIAMSDQIAETIAERYPIAAERIVVAPARIDVARFDPATMTPQRVEAVRVAWGVKPETRVILVIGRILRRKGHHVIARAARRLKDMGLRDFAFVLVGEDQGRSSYSGELWDLVLATDTSDVIRIAGPPVDAPAAYSAAVAVVAAAVQLEGPQRGLLEAMAMARPVIVSDLAAGPETVLGPPAVAEDRMTGLRFASGNDAELAAALIKLLSATEVARRAIGRRGREHVAARYSGAATMTQVLAVYAEVVRPPRWHAADE